jgi:superfamily II DNA or RNA helicase
VAQRVQARIVMADPGPGGATRHAPGTLVRARGREWIVLPGGDPDLMLVRPLGGADDEIAGIYLPLEPVEPAEFAPPTPDDLGDFRSCRLLREALRLGVRDSAGPFRCFGRIAVEPRPYQLVPLLMALRLDPVRLLIADDVGVGKTVEAGLVAKELLEQGDATRLAVLCPPHLAEQWQEELAAHFHIDAEAVLPGTAARLERGLGIGESLFARYPHVVVSTDFIKSDRRRHEFARACPDLVIVDEAHTCADPSGGRGRHQRYALVSEIAADPRRHLILVTATPHSGNVEGFRALLGFLDPSFRGLPEDLTQAERIRERRRLARHVVQRRRADLRHYLAAETPFPDRESAEVTYTLSEEYKRFFRRVLDYCRESIRGPAPAGAHRQRVRWWAVLALLRALGSSPAAAAATLRERTKALDTATAEEADEVGRRAVLDLGDGEGVEGTDVTPGADPGGDDAWSPERRRLLDLAAEAEGLRGDHDHKLSGGIRVVRELVAGGFHPIVFCRFIDTAEYLAQALRDALPGVAVEAVTGRLPPSEREERVRALGRAPGRVLVATDCLSEGINLQDHFDAVVHYDLSWNPTRHEQREGRVDRFGQPRPVVRTVTYYGSDNPVDGVVLHVLLRKHRAIRDSLGISVPVPANSDAVLEAILESLLLRGGAGAQTGEQLALFEAEVLAPRRAELFDEWDRAADRERRSRTVFAQETLRVDEVAREVAAAREAVGSPADVAWFVAEALRAHGAAVSREGLVLRADLGEVPRGLRDTIGLNAAAELRARTELPVSDGEVYLPRTHPVVAGLAAYVLDNALDPIGRGAARRVGVIRTREVERRTTLLLLRLRFDLSVQQREEARQMLVEEARLAAFSGTPEEAEWLPDGQVSRLLGAAPAANVAADQARQFARRAVEGLRHLRPALEAEARRRAGAILDAHSRVREGARLRGVRYDVRPRLPVDVLGVYVYLPAGSA